MPFREQFSSFYFHVVEVRFRIKIKFQEYLNILSNQVYLSINLCTISKPTSAVFLGPQDINISYGMASKVSWLEAYSNLWDQLERRLWVSTLLLLHWKNFPNLWSKFWTNIRLLYLQNLLDFSCSKWMVESIFYDIWLFYYTSINISTR